VELDDPLLLAKVRNGTVGVLEAGEEARNRLAFIRAFHAMTPAARAAVAKEIGAGTLWDELVLPALNTTTE
jgi:hypothetical protein